ncbi:MAG: CheR family methyltransferase [Thermodesulfovibrionales bacterium]|nr:CheR family methyltransferase [Thermodesulfovibrionales bacterium]
MRHLQAEGIDLSPFKTLIKERCGLFFDETREASLAEGLRARMSEKGIKSYLGYLERLKAEREEFSLLINLITVNETYFFREPAHLRLLAEKLVPELLSSKKTGEKVKIISAGCSTGEEPYSLVIALMEKYGPGIKGQLSVMGFDIDDNALRMAENGDFTIHSFRDFPGHLRDKYFEAKGINSYRIRDFIRESVRFERVNLFDAEYQHCHGRADIIFYRNVSIYFEPETQKKVFKKLAELLNENGYLFLSSTETYFHNIGVLSLLELEGSFLYKKNPKPTVKEGAERPAVRQGMPLRPPLAKKTEAKETIRPAVMNIGKTKSPDRRGDELFERALSLAQEKKYSEALGHIEILLDKAPTFMKAHMLKAGILINSGRLEDAEKACLKGLEIDRWCLEGHLLHGIIAKTMDDTENALRKFKEAVYIESSCWLAHFYIADIYRGMADRKKACREYEIVINLLSNGRSPDHGLTFFPLSFTVEQVIHLCRHSLSALKEK